MALPSICAKLFKDQDLSCVKPTRKYFQQIVAINKSDIDPATVVITKTDTTVADPVCAYNVSFELFEGKTGFMIKLPENGASVFGTFDKSRSDFGQNQYIHNVNIFIVGADEAAKCNLEALDEGNYVVALQLMDGTVEIYGMDYGLTTGDYSYDLQSNGGGSAVVLSSNESTPEGYLPLVYKPADAGDANADFNSKFANPVTP